MTDPNITRAFGFKVGEVYMYKEFMLVKIMSFETNNVANLCLYNPDTKEYDQPTFRGNVNELS